MTDRLVRGLFPAAGLRAVFARVGDTARLCRVLHGLAPTSARVFAEALAGALLLAALLEEKSRVNLRLDCDGPLGGLLVDASPEGEVRGYVRAPAVHFPGDPRRGARASLGGAGTLSVLRDLGGGRTYRGAVELHELELAGDLRRYFAESEQVDTALDLQVLSRGDEPLGDVAGLLLQKLPDGDPQALARARERLAGGALEAALQAGASPEEAVRAAGGEGFQRVADAPVAYVCGCSLARARAAVSVLGVEGIAELLRGEKQATVDCEFCHQRYELREEALRAIQAGLRARN
jgi:molecular chaperone Hsp33